MTAVSAPAGVLDADVGDLLAAGLLPGGVPTDLASFEAAFVAAVEAGDPDRDRAWDAFYDATLARVEQDWEPPTAGGALASGTVATFTRIWSRAAGLARGGRVLDVGTCFGFLPLAWAARPAAPELPTPELLAVDLSAASVGLATRQARRLGRPVRLIQADAARLPLPDAAAGTVLLLHLLEHLPAGLAERVLREALRVADRRVVVAVPVEAAPDPVFGHVQVYDPARLAHVGAGTGWRATVTEADGAWLVLDRP